MGPATSTNNKSINANNSGGNGNIIICCDSYEIGEATKNLVIRKGDSVSNDNKEYKAVFEDDGNFVLYKSDSPIWETKTAGQGGQVILLQDDESLVMQTEDSKVVWSTKIPFKPSQDLQLAMDDKGQLVMTRGTEVIWKAPEQ